MTHYTNGEIVWSYQQMRHEVFPAEIEAWTWTSPSAAS